MLIMQHACVPRKGQLAAGTSAVPKYSPTVLRDHFMQPDEWREVQGWATNEAMHYKLRVLSRVFKVGGSGKWPELEPLLKGLPKDHAPSFSPTAARAESGDEEETLADRRKRQRQEAPAAAPHGMGLGEPAMDGADDDEVCAQCVFETIDNVQAIQCVVITFYFIFSLGPPHTCRHRAGPRRR